MSESLLQIVLARVSKFPSCEFWDFELRPSYGTDLDSLVTKQVLRPLPVVPGRLVFPCRTKTTCEAAGREIVESDEKLWAVCNCPLAEAPHQVVQEDLRRYEFSEEQFTTLLATSNGLRGRPSQLDGRVWFLGDSLADGENVAWVLALLRNEDESVMYLESILTRLPSSYAHVLVLSHALVLPPADSVRLHGLGVALLPVLIGLDLRVSTDQLPKLGPRRLSDSASWPDSYFQDEDGTWLTAKILREFRVLSG